MAGGKSKLRTAYLRRKEEDERTEKKAKLAETLKENKTIPHNLRADAAQLLDEMIYDPSAAQPTFLPPKIAVTTSHDPSSMLKAFAKHISLVFNGLHLMRGRMTNETLSEYCREQGVTHLIVLNETKGNPSTLILCKYPNGPTYRFSLFNLKHQRRAKAFGEKVHLVIDGMDTQIGLDLKQNLALCFPTVKDGNRLVAFVNRGGTIAFRHYFIENRKLEKECEFDMKLFKVTNSTFDMDGDVDYVLNAFTNTRKDDILKEE
ncbi:U3 small nucleolar ribonucleoprotein IMP4 [Pancytospora philotis]|nr:U3 small nucleolar ribonucleoprotein IMP4 [Pancytospora philotis]